MARISSEDCLKHVSSPFALVHVAVRRARQLQLGSKPLVERPGDKLTVTALREIAAGLIEEVPMSGPDQEDLRTAGVTEDQEFDQIMESPDLNVQLDLDPDELAEQAASRKSSRKSTSDDDDFDELDAGDGGDEDEDDDDDF